MTNLRQYHKFEISVGAKYGAGAGAVAKDMGSETKLKLTSISEVMLTPSRRPPGHHRADVISLLTRDPAELIVDATKFHVTP